VPITWPEAGSTRVSVLVERWGTNSVEPSGRKRRPNAAGPTGMRRSTCCAAPSSSFKMPASGVSGEVVDTHSRPFWGFTASEVIPAPPVTVIWRCTVSSAASSTYTSGLPAQAAKSRFCSLLAAR